MTIVRIPYINHGNSRQCKRHSHFITKMETAPQTIDLMMISPTEGMQVQETEEVSRLKGGGARGLLETLA